MLNFSWEGHRKEGRRGRIGGREDWEGGELGKLGMTKISTYCSLLSVILHLIAVLALCELIDDDDARYDDNVHRQYFYLKLGVFVFSNLKIYVCCFISLFLLCFDI